MLTDIQTFKNPKGEFLRALEEGGDAGGRKADKKRAGGKRDKNIDMEKLADQMQQLHEEDLLHVVQMIHDGKSADSYIKNDADNGEFHVDLYTLPDQLVKTLWEFVMTKKAE
jgi:transcription initiation factor IIF auxiliary subunit